jgi:hypothetical protein
MTTPAVNMPPTMNTGSHRESKNDDFCRRREVIVIILKIVTSTT